MYVRKSNVCVLYARVFVKVGLNKCGRQFIAKENIDLLQFVHDFMYKKPNFL